MELLQIADDAAARLPQARRVLMSPAIVAFHREPIDRPVKTRAALPLGTKNRRHDRLAGRPRSESKRRVRARVPRLRRRGKGSIAGKFEPEGVTGRRVGALGRRYFNDGPWPRGGKMFPSRLRFAKAEIRPGAVLLECPQARRCDAVHGQPSTRFSGTRSKHSAQEPGVRSAWSGVPPDARSVPPQIWRTCSAASVSANLNLCTAHCLTR